MSFKIKPDYPRPDGLVVFEYADVAGIPFRKPNALAFAKGKHHTRQWEQEPSNKHDKNAVRIFGCNRDCSGKVNVTSLQVRIFKITKISILVHILRA